MATCHNASDSTAQTERATRESNHRTDTAIGECHYHAGFNMPGYLPESEPETFGTFAEARDYLADEMRRHAESEASWSEEHDCSDVPCPTFGDSCHDSNASAIEAEAEDLAGSEGPEWSGFAGDLAYWISECRESECAPETDDEDDAPELPAIRYVVDLPDGRAVPADPIANASDIEEGDVWVSHWGSVVIIEEARTFIGYRQVGYRTSTGAWATAHLRLDVPVSLGRVFRLRTEDGTK